MHFGGSPILSILDLPWHPRQWGSPLPPAPSLAPVWGPSILLVLTRVSCGPERIDLCVISTMHGQWVSNPPDSRAPWPHSDNWVFSVCLRSAYRLLFLSAANESNSPDNYWTFNYWLKWTTRITDFSFLPDPVQWPLSYTEFWREVLELHIRHIMSMKTLINIFCKPTL